jgi:hypothetical protein
MSPAVLLTPVTLCNTVNGDGGRPVIESRHPVTEISMDRSISRMFVRRIGALLLAMVALTAASASNAGVYLSVTIAPPMLRCMSSR